MTKHTLLFFTLMVATVVAQVAAADSSLRGSPPPRELSWGSNRNKKKQGRNKPGCNGKKCTEDENVANEFHEVISIDDTKNETAVTTETQGDEKDKVPCNKKRGKCGKAKGNDEGASDAATKSQQNSSPLQVMLSSLPMCCECTRLPCECQFDSTQTSLLFKRIQNSVQEEESAVKGEPSDVEDANVAENSMSAKLMCCCNDCSDGSFPCNCSCDHFTLSQAPPFP